MPEWQEERLEKTASKRSIINNQPVNTSMQNDNYSNTCYQFDKLNWIEASKISYYEETRQQDIQLGTQIIVLFFEFDA